MGDRKKITAVTISKSQVYCGIEKAGIPFYCHSEGYRPVWRTEKDRDRIEYLAERRNKAHERALELYPETEYFLDIDSYYVDQTSALLGLLDEYSSLEKTVILGASTWWIDGRYVPLKINFWDTWTTPEGRGKPYGFRPSTPNLHPGMIKVEAVGGLVIYPRSAFERAGFGVPEPFPEAGNEINYMCRASGLDRILTFNVRGFHPSPFPPLPLPTRIVKSFLISNTWQSLKDKIGPLAPENLRVASSRFKKELRLNSKGDKSRG